MSHQGNQECAGCHKPITDRYMLNALDLLWHEYCLKCSCCDCLLSEIGTTCYTRRNLILCKRDYLRLFGATGNCAVCSKMIPAFEMVMKAGKNVYHLDCFACQQCNHRFCVGDKFYLCDDKVLCEYDYEERMVFARVAFSPSTLAHLRKRISNLKTVEILDKHSKEETHPAVSIKNQHPVPKHKQNYYSEGPKNAINLLKDDSSSGYGSPDSIEER